MVLLASRSALRSGARDITRRSRRSRCIRRSPTGSIETTSSSTIRLAPRAVPPATPSRSPPKAARPSVRAVVTARSNPVAQPRSAAECSTSVNMTTNSSRRAAPGVTATSLLSTANGGRWSNDRSPGSSPAATAASATAASNATNLVSRCGSPRSTSAASSISASPATDRPGRSPKAGPGTDNEGTTPSSRKRLSRSKTDLAVGQVRSELCARLTEEFAGEGAHGGLLR